MSELEQGLLRGATVAITGATGNLGTALLRALARPGTGIGEIRGLARHRPPDVEPYDRVRWYEAELADPASEQDLAELVDGADAVVHLAWQIRTGHDPDRLHRVNVEGSRRVAQAAAAAGAAQFVHLSSLAAYSPAAPGQQVTEDWPTTGIPSSHYSRDKAEAERLVWEVFLRHPDTTLTVVRPTLVLQPEASSELGRYFLGPLLFGAVRALPGPMARLLPLPVPAVTASFVHADDVADGLVRMLDRRAPGPFNLGTEPPLDAAAVARALGGRRLPMPFHALRAGAGLAYAARLVPAEPGWLDVAVQAPALNSTRAQKLLDWSPRYRGDEVLAGFADALRRGAGAPGPKLAPAGGPALDPAGAPANAPVG